MAAEANRPVARVVSYDTVLPSQHFAPRRKGPEQRLMMAVLHDALECVEKYRFATDIPGQRIFFEARQWLVADATAWPYCFERICETLDLDPGAVRRRLRVVKAPASQRVAGRLRTPDERNYVSRIAAATRTRIVPFG